MTQQGIYISPDNIVPNNGSPQDYLITKTEPPCCGLMAEQIVEFFNNN